MGSLRVQLEGYLQSVVNYYGFLECLLRLMSRSYLSSINLPLRLYLVMRMGEGVQGIYLESGEGG